MSTKIIPVVCLLVIVCVLLILFRPLLLMYFGVPGFIIRRAESRIPLLRPGMTNKAALNTLGLTGWTSVEVGSGPMTNYWFGYPLRNGCELRITSNIKGGRQRLIAAEISGDSCP